jgi:hypothetical protein
MRPPSAIACRVLQLIAAALLWAFLGTEGFCADYVRDSPAQRERLEGKWQLEEVVYQGKKSESKIQSIYITDFFGPVVGVRFKTDEVDESKKLLEIIASSRLALKVTDHPKAEHALGLQVNWINRGEAKDSLQRSLGILASYDKDKDTLTICTYCTKDDKEIKSLWAGLKWGKANDYPLPPKKIESTATNDVIVYHFKRALKDELTDRERQTYQDIVATVNELRTKDTPNPKQIDLLSHLDKARSIPRVGYYVWEGIATKHYYDGKLIRSDAWLPAGRTVLLSALKKKFGEPKEGPMFEWMKAKDRKAGQLGNRYHWESKYVVPLSNAEKIEMKVLLEFTEIKGEEEECILSLCDIEQAKKAGKAVSGE